MPRTARRVEGGMIYHVLNRGNGRMRLFHKPGDYEAFLAVLAKAQQRVPMDLLAYCLMPNHWHLVLRPKQGPDLGRFMGWLGVTHVRRHHEHYHTRGGGHLYQGRYKSFPVQDDEHLLTLLRYVEANAVRAGLVQDAREWRWGSLAARGSRRPPVALCDWPMQRPRNWAAVVNGDPDPAEAKAIRTSIARGRPYGSAAWVARIVQRLGLQHTLRNAGRPRKGGNQ